MCGSDEGSALNAAHCGIRIVQVMDFTMFISRRWLNIMQN
ncbi:hypothetical protein BN1221_03204 [Brenneria goodwinii]|uniref:Uncharacterized protein n=1 Tax=Brenneria goodwinii TaxID=1109412 RepID=A0A0G4JYG6_9GAMM|nr:hypothetical protein BN1221_03204 [Brenneria goodwinii]